MGEIKVQPSNGTEYVANSTLDEYTTAVYSDDGEGCCMLCYDCEKGSYCWKSEINN